MRVATAVLISFLLTAAALAAPGALQTKQGKISKVTLLEVAAAPGAVPKLSLDGATHGIQLAFLIVSQPGEEGKFRLSELRDVMFDGKSYHETTQKQFGREFEPETQLYDVDKYLAQRGDLTGAVGILPVDARAVVMVTALGGGEVPAKGKGLVTIVVGWGDSTEPFEFEIDLKALHGSAKQGA